MKFLQNIHAIRDLVGLYGVTKIDKSEWKVSTNGTTMVQNGTTSNLFVTT